MSYSLNFAIEKILWLNTRKYNGDTGTAKIITCRKQFINFTGYLMR